MASTLLTVFCTKNNHACIAKILILICMLGPEWVISGDDKVIDIIAWCDIDILLLLHIFKASGNINIDTPLQFILKQTSEQCP